MLKKECRQLMNAKRNALSASDCIKLDDLLLIQFQRLNWGEVNCVGSFIQWSQKMNPIQCY